METYVYAYCIYWAVTYTECQVSRNIACNLFAILVFTDSLFELGIELSLQLSHSSLNNWVADDGICCGLWYTTCNVSIAEVVWKVTDTWNLVYRLVLQADTSLELILGSEVPLACLEIHTNNRSEAHTALVTAQLDVCCCFLGWVKYHIERHCANLDVLYISVVVGRCIDTTYTCECAEVVAELISGT